MTDYNYAFQLTNQSSISYPYYPGNSTYTGTQLGAYYKSGDTIANTVSRSGGGIIGNVESPTASHPDPANGGITLASPATFSLTSGLDEETVWYFFGKSSSSASADASNRFWWRRVTGSVSISNSSGGNPSIPQIVQGQNITGSVSQTGLLAATGNAHRLYLRVWVNSSTADFTYFNGGTLAYVTSGSLNFSIPTSVNTPTGDYTLRLSHYAQSGTNSGAAYQTNPFYGTNQGIATATFRIIGPDTTPAPFSLGADFTNVGVNTTVTTSSATITGIDAAADISVSGDGSPEYQIGNGGFTSNSQQDAVNSGDSVTMKFTASSSAGTAHIATLTVGGVSDSVTATTASASDSTPEPFTFVPNDYQNFALSTFQTTNPVTITGIDTEATVTLTSTGNSPDAKWAKGENPSDSDYGTASGTVVNNDKVRIKFRSSPLNFQSNTATLNVGGVSDTVSITTASATSGSVVSAAPGGAIYGLEVRNASGNTIFGPNMRSGHLVKTGTVAIPMNGTPVDVTSEGIEAGNAINLVLDIGLIYTGQDVPAIVRVNATITNGVVVSPGYFRITYQLNTNASISSNYKIIRY